MDLFECGLCVLPTYSYISISILTFTCTAQDKLCAEFAVYRNGLVGREKKNTQEKRTNRTVASSRRRRI